MTENAGLCRGASPGTNTEEFVARVERLKDEVRRLDKIEKDMDKHRQVSLTELMKMMVGGVLAIKVVNNESYLCIAVVRTEFKKYNGRIKQHEVRLC